MLLDCLAYKRKFFNICSWIFQFFSVTIQYDLEAFAELFALFLSIRGIAMRFKCYCLVNGVSTTTFLLHLRRCLEGFWRIFSINQIAKAFLINFFFLLFVEFSSERWTINTTTPSTGQCWSNAHCNSPAAWQSRTQAPQLATKKAIVARRNNRARPTWSKARIRRRWSSGRKD